MKELTALGAYIFAGGFTLGVKKHFKVLEVLEQTDYGVATMRHNQPEIPVVVGPENWHPERFTDRDIDLLYGNPPCAAWSVAGYTKTRGSDKWRTDPRVECTVKHFNLLRIVRPKVWVWESVTQAYSKGQEFVRTLEADAVSMGYSVSYVLHDAQWLGLPQVRKRFFMVCHRIDINWPIPNWAPPPTALEVLSEVSPRGVTHGPYGNEECRRFWLENLPKVPAGMRLRNYWEQTHPEEERTLNPKTGNVKGRPSFGHARLPVGKAGNAVVGYEMVHPTEHRYLTINELQSLCGFPDDYEFVGAKRTGEKASEIARGVCPTVGEWFARCVRSAVEHGSPVTTPTVREVDLRRPPHVDDAAHLVRFLDPFRPMPVGPGVTSPTSEDLTPSPTVRPTRAPRPKPGVPREPFAKFLQGMGYTSKEVKTICAEHYPEEVMVKEKKAPRAKGAPRVAPAGIVACSDPPYDGEGSGAFMRRCWLTGTFTGNSLLNLVKDHWPDRKTQISDVYYNYRLMLDSGHYPNMQPWRK